MILCVCVLGGVYNGGSKQNVLGLKPDSLDLLASLLNDSV